ncbi:MFS transporter [Nocardioides bigeumensis]|uniref:MFS transporter n=1 Tax=Nocardioides bigeumensis TaxID=433657 RepID=UPI0031E45BE6
MTEQDDTRAPLPGTVPVSTGILAPAYAATTIGMFALIAIVAFEAMAVVTVMPSIARDLDGVPLYALSFAAPLASGVIGMVAAGGWSDRRGPTLPLVASLVLFCLGLVVCGTAPTMELLVAGRVLQGLGGGALTVGLYVIVGLVYDEDQQPSVFASFAAAWVLPSLFGPGVAAAVAHAWGWRWVFLSVVVLAAFATLLIAPALRGLPTREPVGGRSRGPGTPLAWAVLAAVAVLAVELLGSDEGAGPLLAGCALVVLGVAVRPLLPRGTLVAARGLPAVIGTRGILAASFFCAEAYIAYVLQEDWDLSPGRAGIALTVVGLVWAGASQVQARLGSLVGHVTLMRVSTATVLVGTTSLWLVVWLHLWAPLAVVAYAVCGAGMGLGYPRTGVAMLAASSADDRGFNAAALSIADALGAALALSVSGVAFTTADRLGGDPFLAAFGVAVASGLVGVLVAARTSPQRERAGSEGAPSPG